MKSNSSLKQKFLRTVIGGALIAGLLPVSNAFAALPAFPTSGSCAMLVTQPVPYGANLGAAGTFNAGYNMLAIITFTSATAATIEFVATRLNYTTNGVTVDPTHPSDAGVAVTLAPVTNGPTSGRRISFTPTGSPAAIRANAIAVNGGSTILIQGESEAFSGVCQF